MKLKDKELENFLESLGCRTVHEGENGETRHVLGNGKVDQLLQRLNIGF